MTFWPFNRGSNRGETEADTLALEVNLARARNRKAIGDLLDAAGVHPIDRAVAGVIRGVKK